MSLVAFLIAFLYVCLGFGAATLLSRRSAAAAAPANAPPAPPEEKTFEITGDQATEFIERIHNLTTSLDSDVDRHATRVAKISGGLTGAERTLSTAAAESAAAELLEANRLLQHDLASAKEEIKKQRVQLASYMAEALTDPLTGLANRRNFDQELARRFGQWRRNGTPLSLVLVDVDEFKRFNDEHGHQAGDAVLFEVGHVLSKTVREMDLVTRYGGEEFGLILPGTGLEDAKTAAERVRRAIDEHVFEFGGRNLHVTVSAGLAEAMLANDRELLVTRTDAALYAAKHAGRNCCQAHDGKDCIPVEKIVSETRTRSLESHRIAPFVDGSFPDPDMFHDVKCEELSAGGFTFISRERPEFDKVLMALGGEKSRNYTSASVKNCLNIGSDAAPVYRIKCQFTAPVSEFSEFAAAVAP